MFPLSDHAASLAPTDLDPPSPNGLPPSTKHHQPGLRAMIRVYVYQPPIKGKPGSGQYVYDREFTRILGKFSVMTREELAAVVAGISGLLPRG